MVNKVVGVGWCDAPEYKVAPEVYGWGYMPKYVHWNTMPHLHKAKQNEISYTWNFEYEISTYWLSLFSVTVDIRWVSMTQKYTLWLVAIHLPNILVRRGKLPSYGDTPVICAWPNTTFNTYSMGVHWWKGLVLFWKLWKK